MNEPDKHATPRSPSPSPSPSMPVVVMMSLMFGMMGALGVTYLTDRFAPNNRPTQFAIVSGSRLTYASINEVAVYGERKPTEIVEEINEAIEAVGQESGFVLLDERMIKYGDLPDLTEEVASRARLDLTLQYDPMENNVLVPN